MDLTKRKPAKDDSSVRAYFFREGIEVCLVLGGLVIAEWFTRVPLWLWFLLPVGKLSVSILFYIFFVKRILRQSSHHGVESLIGRNAYALVPLAPDGQIKIGSEIWAARSRSGETIAVDQIVVICEIRGKLLLVEEAR
ncbi:NfeD family protein [Candidatus Bipolaricaulota bacterium]|nr:NfeD family protein [Candidatus Bipolaricaulota bacterium]